MPEQTSETPQLQSRVSWMRRILIAFGLFGAFLAIFAVVVALQPNEFKIARSTTINALPADAYRHVADFHLWEAWSPWAKLDPNAKNTFEGPSSGKGAIFKWSGNNEVGEGGMTIVDCTPSESLQIRLDFVRPLEDTSNVEFTFKPTGQQTVVTWSMEGKSNFIGKAFCLFMNMEKMLGGQFETGLASLKKAVESEQAP